MIENSNEEIEKKDKIKETQKPDEFNPILQIETGDEKDGTEEQTDSNEN